MSEEQEHQACSCHRTKERTEKEYKDLINRLSRIEGQYFFPLTLLSLFH